MLWICDIGVIATVRVIIKGSFRDSNDYFRNSSTWADIHHLIPLRGQQGKMRNYTSRGWQWGRSWGWCLFEIWSGLEYWRKMNLDWDHVRLLANLSSKIVFRTHWPLIKRKGWSAHNGWYWGPIISKNVFFPAREGIKFDRLFESPESKWNPTTTKH